MHHFYAYNECPNLIVVTASFVNLSGSSDSSETQVLPGHQRSVAVASQGTVEMRATCDDGRHSWRPVTLETTDAEFTHVYSCDCDPATEECPDTWPGDLSRQLPD